MTQYHWPIQRRINRIELLIWIHQIQEWFAQYLCHDDRLMVSHIGRVLPKADQHFWKMPHEWFVADAIAHSKRRAGVKEAETGWLGLDRMATMMTKAMSTVNLPRRQIHRKSKPSRGYWFPVQGLIVGGHHWTEPESILELSLLPCSNLMVMGHGSLVMVNGEWMTNWKLD